MTLFLTFYVFFSFSPKTAYMILDFLKSYFDLGKRNETVEVGEIKFGFGRGQGIWKINSGIFLSISCG